MVIGSKLSNQHNFISSGSPQNTLRTWKVKKDNISMTSQPLSRDTRFCWQALHRVEARCCFLVQFWWAWVYLFIWFHSSCAHNKNYCRLPIQCLPSGVGWGEKAVQSLASSFHPSHPRLNIVESMQQQYAFTCTSQMMPLMKSLLLLMLDTVDRATIIIIAL